MNRMAPYTVDQLTGSPIYGVDPGSHNANPTDVFDGEPVPPSDVADTRITDSVAALRRFVAEHGPLPTPRAGMRPPCGRLRRQSGADSAASERRSSGPR
jgi:hypothetical protein